MSNVVDISGWEAAAEAEARQKKAEGGRAKAKAATAPGADAEKEKFQFVPVGSLKLRSPEFLVDGLIETDALGMVFGAPKHGKSFIAVDLALCVAAGVPFHDRAVKQGPVFYIAGEGHNGLTRRFHAWASHRGVSLDGVPLFKSERAAQFLSEAHAKAVTEAVHELAAIHGAPVMIQVDTLARNFGPGDENATVDMGKFIAAMDDLRSNWPGCTVIVVHHTGHDNTTRARGSIAMKGAVDFEYRVEKKSRGLIEVSNPTMKDAPENDPMMFSLETVDLGVDADGKPMSSAVLIPAEAVEAEGPKLSKDAQLARSTYIEAAAAHGIFATAEGLQGVHLDDWRDAFYAKHTGDNPDTKRRAFNRGRQALDEKGLMTVADDVYLTTESDVRIAIVLKRDKRDVP